VLSGGGAKGAFEAGVVAALDDAGVRPEVVSGTSAGAINAAAVACGVPVERLVELWGSLESGDVYRVRRDVHRLVRPAHLLGNPRALLGRGQLSASEHLLGSIGWTWLFHTAPLRRRLVSVLGGEVLPLRDDRVLTVACVNAATGELVRFTNRAPTGERADPSYREVTLTVDHLLASAAIPGVFAPVEVEGSTWWDGGLVANTPLTAAMGYDPETAIVVASGAVESTGRAPRSLGEAASQIIDHVMRFSMVKDMDHAQTVNELVAAAPNATPHRRVRLVPVVPDDGDRTGLGELLDFDPARARQLVRNGRAAGAEAIRRWRDGESIGDWEA
jgi:NTE family protein